MEPVDSFGEWFGLVGGVVVVAAAIVAGVQAPPFHVGLSLHLRARIVNWSCLDPTDPCNWSSYRVRNDTRQPLVLRECDRVCGQADDLGDPFDLPPGATTANDVDHVNAIVGERTWWLVLAADGRRLGCLVLDGHPRKHDGDLVLVSERERCGTDSAPTTRPVSPGT